MRIVLSLTLIACLAGCTKATPTYSKGAATMAEAYEKAYDNSARQFDAQQDALLATYTQKKDVELAVDLQKLSDETVALPAKWNSVSIAKETTRLQSLHDQKIADYAASLAAFRGLKTKNEAVNLRTAHAIRDTLNPPKVPTATVNLESQIDASTGATPPAPIFSK